MLLVTSSRHRSRVWVCPSRNMSHVPWKRATLGFVQCCGVYACISCEPRGRVACMFSEASIRVARQARAVLVRGGQSCRGSCFECVVPTVVWTGGFTYVKGVLCRRALSSYSHCFDALGCPVRVLGAVLQPLLLSCGKIVTMRTSRREATTKTWYSIRNVSEQRLLSKCLVAGFVAQWSRRASA